MTYSGQYAPLCLVRGRLTLTALDIYNFYDMLPPKKVGYYPSFK